MVNAFVEATPISGPARVYRTASATRVVMEPTTLVRVALLLILATNAGCWGSMSSTETVYSAEYSDMSFSGDRQTYYDFGSGDEDSPEAKIAPVYLKLRDGKVLKLTDVSESMARDWSMLSPNELARKSNIIKRKGRSGISLTSYYVTSSSVFVFHEGKLVRCAIDPGAPESPLEHVEIGMLGNTRRIAGAR